MEIQRELTGDELFEELGYEKLTNKGIYGEKISVIYKNKNYEYISFWLNYKKVHTAKAILSLQELQAINQKCKELGWI